MERISSCESRITLPAQHTSLPPTYNALPHSWRVAIPDRFWVELVTMQRRVHEIAPPPLE